MLKRIIFDEKGISTAVYADGSVIEGADDVYEVEHSTSGYYQKVGEDIEPCDRPLHYTEARRNEYPAIGDQLDAILKYIDGDGADVTDVIAAWKAVKAKYPKK